MQAVLRTRDKPAKIKLRTTVKNLPTDALVEVTDFMLQPDEVVSGWLPHVTEIPWSAGLTYLNTTPTGEIVYWDSIEGKPVVFPPANHQHDASDISSGVLDLARVPVLDNSKLGAKSVTSDKLSDTLMDLLDQHTSTIASLQAKINGLELGYRSKRGDDEPNTYPVGVSVGLFSSMDGWPAATAFWTVATFAGPGFVAAKVQHAYPYNTPTIQPLYRVALSAAKGGGWTAWENLRGA